MAPIVVDPHLLAGAGSAVGGVGDELAAAVGTLGSALAGCGAMAGHDAAGIAFGRAYEQAAQSVVNVVDSAVNACRKTGFGVAMSATNYSRAEAASTIGGGEALPAPSEPPGFEAPRLPSPFGSGVAAPAAWYLVETFVGSLWPDGSPEGLRAAAGAWREFASAVGGVAGQLHGPAGVVSGQQIPEEPAMTSALSQIGEGASQIADECGQLAIQLDEFADDVQSTQDAIRDLLHRLGTPGGLFHEVVAVFKGDAFDEIKKVADDISAVMHNFKRQADARQQLLPQAMAALDSTVVGFEAHMRKEFTHYLGETVGNQLATFFETDLNTVEGLGKGAVGLAETFSQFDPTRFAYDPQGAAATWKSLWDLNTSANPMFHPLHPGETLQADKEFLKKVVHAEDWGSRPGLAFGENVFDIATLALPGVGEAGAGAKGAELAGGAARGAKAGGEAADAAGAAGRTGARAGEAAADAAGAFTPISEQSGKLAANLDKVGDDIMAGAQPGHVPAAGPAPVLDHAPPVAATPTEVPVPSGGHLPENTVPEHVPAGAGGAMAEPRVGPHWPAPVGEHPTLGGVHEPAPVASAPHPTAAPGEQFAGSGAAHAPQSAAPHLPSAVDGRPAEATLTGAHAPEATAGGGQGPLDGSPTHGGSGVPAPHDHVDAPASHAPPPDDGLDHVSAESGGPGAWNQDLNHPAPLTHYTVDDRFSYTTDADGRVNHAEMTYDRTHEPGDRNTYQQRIAGGDDRLPGDHGGHIFGTQFGGPGEGINITAMRDTLNAVGDRDYYNLEQQWRAYAEAGGQVQVTVDIVHPEGSMRPETYSVETYVDGQLKSTYHFDN